MNDECVFPQDGRYLRCVNLDWLEVHAHEPIGQPHGADFFRAAGFVVHERDYGTRVYKEMFSLDDNEGQPFLEIRRNPASQKPLGLHYPEECHLRLHNYACYHDNAAELMANFLDMFGYEFKRISRVDICLDFEKFDSGDDPQKFLRRYLQRVYSKINQGNINAHGSDTWTGQEWNSLSWGSYASDIGTKFYNKTMELYDPIKKKYKKPYIRYAWLRSGLIDDFIYNTKTVDGKTYTPQIWRVEFSIRSSVKNWFKIELNGKSGAWQSIRNDLQHYMGRDRLLVMFASLANHYFHFKYFEEGKRKDRCEDKDLFDFKSPQFYYKVGAKTIVGSGTSANRPVYSLINKLKLYRQTHFEPEINKACEILIKAMESELLRSDMLHAWSRKDLEVLRTAVSEKFSHPDKDFMVLLKELKEFMRINDLTAIF